ncbi:MULTISPECIES: hypothetical protein [Pseudomonas]|uniref:hypothetical protein n=1 Tax=Pseudomonas TaxID=286 RepID=UPI0001E969D3|nr:hypothetical protein [Pseudomonas sp. FP597]EFQ63375.1 hypothetical protein PFWH6_3056 [Pseudomonas fluorescens WH6]WLI04122.1 hypothetical protein PSH66_16000 [Pseudomonas sp. FP597]
MADDQGIGQARNPLMPRRNIFEIKGLQAKANEYIMAPIERIEALKTSMYSMS